MFSTNEVFIRSLPKTALMLGKNLGIKIKFVSGVVPQTDCESEIQLPVLKEDANIGDRKAFLGSLVHECGHVKHTNPSASKGLRNKMIQHLTNVVEDVRMEKLVQEEYPGARLLFEAVGKDILRIHKEEGCTPENVQSLFIFYCIFSAEISFAHKTYYQPIVDELEGDSRLTESCKKAVTKLLDKELPTLTSTADSVELARKLKRIFEKEYGSCPQQEEPESKSGKGKSRKGKGKKAASSGSGASAGTDDSEGSLTNDFEMDDRFDTSSRFNRLISDCSKRETDIDQQMVEPEEAISTARSPSDRIDPNDRSEGLRIINRSRQNCAGLKRGLSALVESVSREAFVPAYAGKKLDSGRISRLSNWDLRVFKKSSESKGFSTAFHILLDASGSMSGCRGDTALDCALALFEAVSRIPRTNPSLSIFPNVQGFVRGDRVRKTIVPHGARKLSAYADRIGEIRFFAGTPMLEALKQVRMIMNLLKEDRKIVFVITDGGFCEPKDKIEELRREFDFDGVELAAIGIDSGLTDQVYLKLFYGKNFVVIERLAELRSAVANLAKRMMKVD